MSPLKNKNFLVTGWANKKSVAHFAALKLIDQGAKVHFSIQKEEIRQKLIKVFPHEKISICDVTDKESIKSLALSIERPLDGLLHSMAYANFTNPPRPFHDVPIEDFLQASHISCFSLMTLTSALLPKFKNDASIVTVSISDTKATNYGYLGPIKAALNTSVPYLAKSLSKISSIRVNAVCAGPLKTSASAGIPGYVDQYLFSQELTLRKKALYTQEVAEVISFLLSPLSSGINGSEIPIDAGMRCNHFDENIVRAYSKDSLKTNDAEFIQ